MRLLLRDDQWEPIKGLLPGRQGDPGVTARDNRLFVEAVLWIEHMGAPARPAQGFRQVVHGVHAVSPPAEKMGLETDC